MILKNVFLIIALIFSSLFYSQEFSDGPPEPPIPPRPPKEKIIESLKEKLDLTPAQISKIEAIDASYTEREEKLHNQMKELREQMAEIRKAKREKISEVLTDDQMKKLKEIMKNKKPRSGKPKTGWR